VNSLGEQWHNKGRTPPIQSSNGLLIAASRAVYSNQYAICQGVVATRLSAVRHAPAGDPHINATVSLLHSFAIGEDSEPCC